MTADQCFPLIQPTSKNRASFDEVGKNFKNQLNKKFKQIAKEKLDSY